MKTKDALLLKQGINLPKLIILSLVLFLTLPQCAVKKVLMTSGTIDKIALLSTTVNFQQQAGISGPAAVARGQFNNRAEEINTIMSQYVDTLHNAVASNIKNQLGSQVLYGKELHDLPQYSELKKKYEIVDALNKEDDHFPEVLISTGDFNFYISETKSGPMHGGYVVTLKADELKNTIIDLCKDLNVNYIAVAQFVLTGFKATILAATDTHFIYTLLIYNQDGDIIAQSGNFESTVKFFKNDLIGSFSTMIETYLQKSDLIELVAVKKKK